MKYITKTVWILSLVSLFTDAASEMLYPIMPIYLQSIGFSIVLIGILEGVAEATAGLSKGYFGRLSDVNGKRVPFVQLGYALSAISKPMMAIFVFPLWIFFARTIDRFGKGIRTGARDALLSDEATFETKGRIFGFHRGMDTLGAVIGPSLALVYLYFYPESYKTLFFIAFIPGLLAVISSFYLKEKKNTPSRSFKSVPVFSFLYFWKKSPLQYRRLVSGLLVFALVNSSDVFLLLKAKQSGLSDTLVIGVYIFYNLIYAITSFPMGKMADKFGLRTIFLLGLLLFVFVYLGMSITTNVYVIVGLFFMYGVYAAATEGISKAWITNLSEKSETATAIGTYAGLQSICMMIASTLTGYVWYRFGSSLAFGVTAGITLLVVLYLLVFTKAVGMNPDSYRDKKGI
ncbi:MAG TPA: MFS transporter [Bacteroidia bacterium]|nr:MFS transporter [Bacteroidota bacterium]MBK8586924.1 MFS transporter [Bacteroidota bacterium]MBP9789759.1 MFS transporter [Bacteroidia bacterium]MBP9923861.1 MFS transporter [Bacteroidia bacterium]HQW22075.1 MFS transporter [Bacteroidia bacterium]